MPKEGDIYRWCWNSQYVEKLKDKSAAGTLYWCCSQICIFRNGMYFDTYWNNSGDSKRFMPEEADEKLDLEYIGNFSELEESSKTQRAYYDDKDCVDISHANNTRGGFYIRKGAKRSLEKMNKIILRNIKKLQYDADSAQRRLQEIKIQRENLNTESYIPIMDDVSLFDNSYEDQEVD